MRLPVRDGGPELEVRVESSTSSGGSSCTVLYLHGFGSRQDGEKADFFRNRFKSAGLGFWSFDFQGHGRSAGGMRDLTLSRNLEDIECVRREMTARGHERVVVVGSSMGALSGLWHSALHPQGIEAGLYIAPALGLEVAFRNWAGDDGIERWERDGYYTITNELGSWDLGWGFVEDLHRFPNDRLAERLVTPSLLLQGKLDDRVAWRDVVELATRCEGSGVELHLFADGDHRLVDRKEHLWNLMSGFLRSRGLFE
jgi:pimeloyl-ACP methyl ester carboxylesterase